MILDLNQSYETPVVAVGFTLWVDIHAPLQLVFRYLTEARELERWWCSKASTEPRPGGRIHYLWRGEPELTGEALFRVFEPPNRLVLEWTHHNGEPIVCDGKGHRGMAWPPFNIFELAMINGTTTRLMLRDLGIAEAPAFQALRQSTATGWRETATRLKRVIEQTIRGELKSNLKKRRPRPRRVASEQEDVSD